MLVSVITVGTGIGTFRGTAKITVKIDHKAICYIELRKTLAGIFGGRLSASRFDFLLSLSYLWWGRGLKGKRQVISNQCWNRREINLIIADALDVPRLVRREGR